MKFSKEKWAETKLSWQRYGGEYIALMFCGLLFLTVIWFFVICPIVNYFHENEISSLKTEILRKVEDNSATLEFSNENEAKKPKKTLKKYPLRIRLSSKISRYLKIMISLKSKLTLKAQNRLRFL